MANSSNFVNMANFLPLFSPTKSQVPWLLLYFLQERTTPFGKLLFLSILIVFVHSKKTVKRLFLHEGESYTWLPLHKSKRMWLACSTLSCNSFNFESLSLLYTLVPREEMKTLSFSPVFQARNLNAKLMSSFSGCNKNSRGDEMISDE